MFSQFVFWAWSAGLIVLIGGLVVVRRDLAAARGLNKLIVLGPVMLAAPLATFGAEHLAGARFVMQGVPAWIPWHLFWAYFVGIALEAAAISIALRRYVHLSASLLGLMIFLFVVFIHIPKVAANPGDRIAWAVAVRDLAFAAGAWTLAGSQIGEWGRRYSRAAITVGRLCIGAAVVFFGVEHFLHPEFAPGVPLSKLTPAWVPIREFWGYLTGAILLVAGTGLLVNKKVRTAATYIGLLMLVLTLFLYAPILAVAAQPPEMGEALNYVADTLMFGGTVLLLARGLSRGSGVHSSDAMGTKVRERV